MLPADGDAEFVAPLADALVADPVDVPAVCPERPDAPAEYPAILIEGGFLSNRAEENRILSAEYREKLAKAIADGILEYKKCSETAQTPAASSPRR